MQYAGTGLGTSGYDYWKSYAGATAYGKPNQPPDLVEDFAFYNHDGEVMWKDYTTYQFFLFEAEAGLIFGKKKLCNWFVLWSI